MSPAMFTELLHAMWETFAMVMVSGSIAAIVGIPLGITLLVTRRHGLLEHATFYTILSMIVNATRSIPFIILLVALIPLTRLLVGTSIGTAAAIVPLSIGAIPFVARLVESALSEVTHGLVETGFAMGASPWQIILHILLPEAMPGIINGITITLVSLVGYSAMAGAVGGGGLGDLAIRYGYQRFDVIVMLYTIVILILFVQLIQLIGDKMARMFTRTL